ncbi:hypothetical protein [Vibrio algarum]|uniref:Uncharacterized protein n=1 Tax=Vibrio algarum TaxID=3020714 RepID=A0ABT4YXH5_9VIBR|nr:hypothetical protein [Vibrio sp. KJ40-1]MDB1126077.1 hypothetical protein [Vibrio sp. KJ40-1]
MEDKDLEIDNLEWLDALEIGFDLSDYELEENLVDEALVINSK